jgi:membrane-bound lytic murein transglycosylase D
MLRYMHKERKIMMFRGVFVLLLITGEFQGFSQISDTTEVKLLADDPILVTLDSMVTSSFFLSSEFTADTALLNTSKWEKGEIPVYDDAHYLAAFKEMDAASPFNFVYNGPVKAYINAYLGKNRAKVGRMLGLAELYYPLFEETLDRYNLPLELKHLAIVESALNPKARSRSGATGLWQFMYRTGKIYDLNSTSYLDDRSDPYKSTVAACEYFRYLHDMFGDWQLVLAAYNGGPGNLLKAIRRAGGKRDYWEVRPFLRRETQGYVPAFFAVNYAMNYASENNVYPVKPIFFSYELDTVVIRKQTNLKTLASVLKIPYAQVQFLNPTFKQDILPETKDGLVLTLPKKTIGIFLTHQESIYDLGKEAVNDAYAKQDEIMRDQRNVHIVRSGETLGGIAARYRCRISELRYWNGIRGNLIRIGQKLVVYSQVASKPSSSSKTTVAAADGKARYHTIQSGDTLWDIAKKNGLSVDKLKELNNISNHYRLKIGSKLKIG